MIKLGQIYNVMCTQSSQTLDIQHMPMTNNEEYKK